MLKAQEKIRAVAADASAVAILGVPPGARSLSVDRVALTYGDRPVEFRRGLCSTRHLHYVNDLHDDADTTNVAAARHARRYNLSLATRSQAESRGLRRAGFRFIPAGEPPSDADPLRFAPRA
jgi:hypothetical protein